MLQRKIHIDSFIIIKKIFNEFGIKRQVDSNGMMKKKSLNLGSLTMQAISYTIRHYEASYLGDFFTRAQNIIILRTSLNRINPFLCYKRGRHCCHPTKNWLWYNLPLLPSRTVSIGSVMNNENLLNFRSRSKF